MALHDELMMWTWIFPSSCLPRRFWIRRGGTVWWRRIAIYENLRCGRIRIAANDPATVGVICRECEESCRTANHNHRDRAGKHPKRTIERSLTARA
ncbi:hypothetical protein HMPREF3196_01913 [Bifidobacterium bifidum]|uniref:Uncharacterized protein n=1 Tax=Bifidobacterium bifidum TaxID=1681 RepID=A0A133KL02_BIFBI|nr:hypothetical protein BIFBIF_01993 [Bifidobacterium bifidum ATCC 29521 = JCM 1255 = DSM 20456]KWZ80202.1 hypothetical protein HMPREF3196_01913 [Bifidobacterium bifidum]